MRLPFTKMQGAGNDFVVLDATRSPIHLTPAQVQRLGDRRFGIGADQVLVVDRSELPGVDFGYRIYNGFSGDEVEHCGNGARCFVRYVREHGLTDKTTVRVATINNQLTLHWQADGRVTVDMGEPVFDHAHIPFDAGGLQPRAVQGFELWPLQGAEVAVLSMGNPHAVMRVASTALASVATLGPAIEHDAHFPQRVNVGFLQPLSRSEAKLRVFERDTGETLACGTGACAAVVAAVRLGWLDAAVEVHTHGGQLLIEWAGMGTPVRMTGPAQTVFEGEIEL